MSVQEKRIIANMVSSTIVMIVYGIIVYFRYQTLTLSVAETLQFWAIAILIFIPASIVARIIIMIIFAIGDNIAAEIKGEEVDDYDIVDERDKLIELRSTRVSLIIFSLGFILALVTLAIELNPTVFFVLMIGFGFLSDIASEAAKLISYSRGV